MILQKNIFILIQSLIFGSCLVVPKTETASVKNCELVTKSWTLEVHEIGLNNECYGCGDFVRGILECGGKSEECITFVAGYYRMDCHSRIGCSFRQHNSLVRKTREL